MATCVSTASLIVASKASTDRPSPADEDDEDDELPALEVEDPDGGATEVAIVVVVDSVDISDSMTEDY